MCILFLVNHYYILLPSLPLSHLHFFLNEKLCVVIFCVSVHVCKWRWRECIDKYISLFCCRNQPLLIHRQAWRKREFFVCRWHFSSSTPTSRCELFSNKMENSRDFEMLMCTVTINLSVKMFISCSLFFLSQF